jgi:hypothetical protein
MGFVILGVVCLGVATTAIAPPAYAGLPNFECIAKGVRIGIDLHRKKALIRRERHATELGSTQFDEQNGKGLGIEILTGSGKWKVDVIEFGKMITIDGPAGKLGGQLTGTCTNVAGTLVLAQTRRPTTIRELVGIGGKKTRGKQTGGKKTRGKRTAILTVPKGTFVWNAGNFDPTNNTLGSKDESYITAVSGKPVPMNHMNITGSEGWVPTSSLINVCPVSNQKPGWDSACK